MIRSFPAAVVVSLFALAVPVFADDKKNDEPKKNVPPFVELLKLTPEEFIKKFDKHNNGVLTKEELPPGLARVFERMDRNGDGKLDGKEVEQMLKVLRERFSVQAKPDAPVKPSAQTSPQVERIIDSMLERMDTNKDGKISKDEARGPLADNFERLDANKDGFLERNELRVAAARMVAMQGAGPGAGLGGGPNALDFDALDKNADGRLTKDEVKGTLLADQFDEIDTNKDGKIDKKEFTAFLKKRAEKK
jgi:Ca2+-binding EF-hand superfamily protein